MKQNSKLSNFICTHAARVYCSPTECHLPCNSNGWRNTYVRKHTSSDSGSFFLPSRGTLSSIELRVLNAFLPQQRMEQGQKEAS